MAKKLTYHSSGVSIKANDDLVRLIQKSLRTTHDGRVLTSPNGFAGLSRLPSGKARYRNPLLVACCDGVGTKVLLAAQARTFGHIGIDLVAMNVNDLVTCGAEPLFFLDYVAVNKNTPKRTAEIVAGIARGCKIAGCALLGGETAEMPDLYRKGEFDLAGFCVGLVEAKHLIRGERIAPGDVVIGLASSGLHSNGYTLIRKIFFQAHKYKLSAKLPGLRRPLGEELLRPTRIYVKPLLSLLQQSRPAITGLAHITGGGLPGNVPRILPEGCHATLRRNSWPVPPIFRIIQSLGVAEKEMFRVFNMGIGMVVIGRRKNVPSVMSHFKRNRIRAVQIGLISKGDQALTIE